jgi:hypothetical protein
MSCGVVDAKAHEDSVIVNMAIRRVYHWPGFIFGKIMLPLVLSSNLQSGADGTSLSYMAESHTGTI